MLLYKCHRITCFLLIDPVREFTLFRSFQFVFVQIGRGHSIINEVININTLRTLQLCFTSIGAVIGACLGGFDGFVIALIILMITDYITGVIEAAYNHSISSKIGYKGILKKILMFVVIAVAYCIDYFVIHSNGALRTATLFFYIANEGISILENISLVGVPIPKKLKAMLEQLRQNEVAPLLKGDDDDDDERH